MDYLRLNGIKEKLRNYMKDNSYNLSEMDIEKIHEIINTDSMIDLIVGQIACEGEIKNESSFMLKLYIMEILKKENGKKWKVEQLNSQLKRREYCKKFDTKDVTNALAELEKGKYICRDTSVKIIRGVSNPYEHSATTFVYMGDSNDYGKEVIDIKNRMGNGKKGEPK